MVRTGIGFDAHAFSGDPARPLVLGGVSIPGQAGLAGHSDADVLSHAVADALLGAAGLGDLGSRFPGDARWKDALSLDILRETSSLVAGAGYGIVNVDVSVVAETPRLAPYRDRMRAGVAGALGVTEDAVSVKATTTDHLGFTGRGEGMAALAVATIRAVDRP
ncbi:MAG TPA: 2-C-methyl-D-erythritol 2,4-cyclodiphosphate synthase [Actinomycetota bacterium]|nr:2-C-methyl-D-erythritol 2,4-cyclodiphosphate synthase [Actinomycetota bacterium]